MMVSPRSVGVALKTLLIIMYFAIIASFVYVFAIDGIRSCYDYGARWDILLVMDFTIFCGVIGAWFHYKESSWIKTAIFFLGVEAVGSVVTIPYIFIQFLKLSPEEYSKDPLYFVLVRRQKRLLPSGCCLYLLKWEIIVDFLKVFIILLWEDNGTTLATARVFFSALGFLLLGILIYTIILDIRGSYAEAFAPCFLTYIVDIYIHIVLLSVWIIYKESSWIIAFTWILLLVFSGTLATIIYILRELFSLSPDQPTSTMIFNNKKRDLQPSSDPLLMSDADV